MYNWVTFFMENASSISKPPIFFAAQPVVAPKALFIGVLSACHGAGAPSLNLRHLLMCIRRLSNRTLIYMAEPVLRLHTTFAVFA